MRTGKKIGRRTVNVSKTIAAANRIESLGGSVFQIIPFSSVSYIYYKYDEDNEISYPLSLDLDK